MKSGFPSSETFVSAAPRRALTAAGLGCALLLLLSSSRVGALPGTHGMAVSSWDTSHSKVVFAYHHGFIGDGHLLIGGYNANFTSTTGKLSAQFGLHYVNYDPESSGMFHGISATAIAVYGIPVADRYDNGLPKGAFTFFIGGAPSALVGDKLNYLTFAFPLGMAIPFSPSRHLSIAPWVELAPSINVDSVIRGYSGEFPVDPEAETVEVELTPEQVGAIVVESVDTEISFAARFRGGLSFTFHLGDKADLSINSAVGHVGSSFTEGVTIFVGGALTFGWDDPPAAVLPPKEVDLRRASCPALYRQFKTCPYYKKFIRKVQRATLKKCPQPEVQCPSPGSKPPGTPPPAPTAD